MTRPAPTVTVPVEADAGLLSVISAMVRRIAVPVSVEDEEVYFDHGHARQIYQAIIQSAPAAPQAAGVGEDDGARLLWNRFAVAHHESWDDEPNKAEYRQAAADVLALRAPSREPEGGAWGEWDERTLGLTVMAILHAEADLEGGVWSFDHDMLVKASKRIAALATREEAPAEAVTQAENPGGYLIKDFADGWAWTPHRIAAVAALTDGHAVYDLRAHPQAREDAQPVAWRFKARFSDLAHSHWHYTDRDPSAAKTITNVQPLFTHPAPDAQPVAWKFRHMGQRRVGVTMDKAEADQKAAAGWEVEPLGPITRPAPEALRVAVEALRKIGYGDGGIGTHRSIAQTALAALQAEQKGGA